MPRYRSSKHIEALKEREEDDEKTVREKARALAQLIRTSGHVVVHTGAGISTSASIPGTQQKFNATEIFTPPSRTWLFLSMPLDVRLSRS